MDNPRKEIYEKLKENANILRDILNADEFNLAEADRLFRERNTLFYQLKDVLVLENVDDEEAKEIENMIKDNNELLEMITNKKEEMEKKFRKKRSDVSKISTYLKG